jgi:competence protein ComGC
MVFKSSSKRRGQTAIELLFITAIILVGVVYILPSVAYSNEAVSLSDAFRTAGSDVCSYLNTAVIVNDSLHSPLNDLVDLWNYTPVGCRLVSLSVETGSSISATLVFEYPSGKFSDAFAGNVTLYLKLRLSNVSGFRLVGENLYYGEKPVNVTVVVR